MKIVKMCFQVLLISGTLDNYFHYARAFKDLDVVYLCICSKLYKTYMYFNNVQI